MRAVVFPRRPHDGLRGAGVAKTAQPRAAWCTVGRLAGRSTATVLRPQNGGPGTPGAFVEDFREGSLPHSGGDS